MRNRLSGAGVVALLAIGAGTALGQGIAIDHKEVSCIVAGKYPKMNACFAPDADVARARVYFRPEGTESWYYVDMKADAPCLSGILPRPRKELVDKHIDYYVHVTDKSFTEARTLEYNPVVVTSEKDCKDKPVAPYLTKAAVNVFPSLPGGFAAGGVGTVSAVGVGAGVAGAAAGGAAIASSSGGGAGGDTTTPTTTVPGGGGGPATTQPTQTTTATTTTTTTQAPQPFRFVFKVSPNPPKGIEPLEVTIDLCASTPQGDLRFFFNFDGGTFDFIGPICKQTRTLTTSSVSSFGEAGGGFPTTTIPVTTTTTTLPPVTTVPTTTTTLPAPVTVQYELKGCAEPRGRPDLNTCATRIAEVTEAAPSFASRSVRIKAFRSTSAPARRLAWNSQLDVEGGAGQVVANGASSVFAGKGRSTALAVGRRGENRIEAQLVQGAGKAGTWRFELAPTASFQAGSLRVIAGDAVQISADTVVFRLKGEPGERIVFTFRTAK